jgi:hypothetical protein
MTPLTPSTTRYAPYWCEENVWHLSIDDSVGVPVVDRQVVFISNAVQMCPMWHQRSSPNSVVFWDYHVVLLARAVDDRRRTVVWDLDTTLGWPVPLEHYLSSSFDEAALTPNTTPAFRVMPVDEFRRVFSSTRAHMRNADDHGWNAPLPPWPAIVDAQGSMNLMRFVDMSDPIAGTVHDLASLRARFGDDVK